jgi:hypothetical protein
MFNLAVVKWACLGRVIMEFRDGGEFHCSRPADGHAVWRMTPGDDGEMLVRAHVGEPVSTGDRAGRHGDVDYMVSVRVATGLIIRDGAHQGSRAEGWGRYAAATSMAF